VSSPLLTADDVAALLGVSKSYVWHLCREDSIPHVRLGRSVRFRQEALDRWLLEVERGRVGDDT